MSTMSSVIVDNLDVRVGGIYRINLTFSNSWLSLEGDINQWTMFLGIHIPQVWNEPL